MNKKVDTVDEDTDTPSVPVYDAQFIEETEPVPEIPISYRLGRVAGSVIAFSGFLYRIGRIFISRRPGNAEKGGGMRRRRGRRKQ
jgi:hypothetical protein